MHWYSCMAFSSSLCFSNCLLKWCKRRQKSYLMKCISRGIRRNSGSIQVLFMYQCTSGKLPRLWSSCLSGNPRVLSSHHIANDGLSVSLTSCLRRRLNSNCPSMISFLLAICALWTCYIASSFCPYTAITPLKIIAFPTSLLELLKSGGGKWGILMPRRRKCLWDRRKVLFWVKQTKLEDCRSTNQVFFQKGKDFSYSNTLWSQLRYRKHGMWYIVCVYIYTRTCVCVYIYI